MNKFDVKINMNEIHMKQVNDTITEINSKIHELK